jgi:hypothetical protein
MVKSGKLNGYHFTKIGGLNKSNPVRVLKKLYDKNGESSIETLANELGLTHRSYLKQSILKVMEKLGQIKIHEGKVKLSIETVKSLNQKNFDLFEKLKLCSFYTPILELNLRHIKGVEKRHRKRKK